MTDMSSRAWFDEAGEGALALIRGIQGDAWAAPGLGDWTVRELAAHTIRSWRLVVDYLDEPVPDGTPISAGRYFAEGMKQPGVHEGVLVRGREDAAQLDDIADAATQAAEAARVRIEGEPDDRLVPTRFGPMTLAEFLRTRAFELAIHGLDLAAATAQPPPRSLVCATVPTMTLLAEVGLHRELVVPLVLAASGRAPLPEGYSLLA